VKPSEEVCIQPLDRHELKAGETYDSWRCQVCQGVIALAPRVPEADPFDLPDGIVLLKCPQCGSERHYAMHERCVRRYPWNGKAPRS
jgi:hypothetical protein